MKLSSRLMAIASLVPEKSYIADVGSDHGELPLYLLETNKIGGAMAIENKKGPFSRLSFSVNNSLYADKILLSLSDGISKLTPNVDTLVLAGMGGLLIKRILLSHPSNLLNVKCIIIDPHKEKEDAILALASLSYRISEAIFLIDKDKPYFIFKGTKSLNPVSYSQEELYLGPTLKEKHDETWVTYFQKEKERMEQLLLLPLPVNKKKDYQTKISYIEEGTK